MIDLRKVVTEHVKDLRKTAIVLAEYPQLKNSSLEVAKAADELEAALAQPEQENECNPYDLCAGCRCAYSRLAQPEQDYIKKLEDDYELDFSTEISDDVIGYLTEKEVEKMLVCIQSLEMK